MNHRNRSIVVVALATLAAPTAWALDARQVEQDLAAFHQNPKAYMNRHLPKRNKRGFVDRTPFSERDVRTREYIVKKALVRERIAKAGGRAGVQLSNDDFRNLVDNGRAALVRLEQVEQAGLMKAALPTQPWSDDYWAIAMGATARRYADAQEDDLENYKATTDYVRSRIGRGPIAELSPAEKYDILMGDANFTLTRHQLDEGAGYFQRFGKVETWMGICHGWAPAAYMLPRPTTAIEAIAVDGKTRVAFRPSDLKALGSLLWANGTERSTKFIGGRCNTKEPATDPSNGRVKDQACFDNNPATFHFTLVNQIGVSKRSVVLDATYDYEVWNQPIQSYSYGYFNPATGKVARTLAAAKVPYASFGNDKFAAYRDPRVKRGGSVVGIALEMTYVAENDPSLEMTDSDEADALTQVIYKYDLELDAEGLPIGGEWYENEHPDFLWTPAPGAHAVSAADRPDRTWNPTSPIPADFTHLAQGASRAGQPLGVVVESLINLSAGRVRPAPPVPGQPRVAVPRPTPAATRSYWDRLRGWFGG